MIPSVVVSCKLHLFLLKHVVTLLERVPIRQLQFRVFSGQARREATMHDVRAIPSFRW